MSTKRYFIDTEFIENGPKEPLILLSIGIKCEDGRTFYAVNAEADLVKANSWVRENVIPHLGKDYLNLHKLKKAVKDFIQDTPEFWGYFADYDWVVFCQLFGTMIDLPTGWPMFCNDIKQECNRKGNPKLPVQDSVEHNALNDAIWNEVAFKFLENL